MPEIPLVLRTDDGDHDLLVEVDDHTTIGQMADRLRERHPANWHAVATLERISRVRTNFPRDSGVTAVDLRTGDIVRLTPDTGLRDTNRAATVARLLVVQAGRADRWVTVSPGETTLGRSSGCDIQIDDDLASRRHARLRATDVVQITDLGSANGTLVNGFRVAAPRLLRTGDEVRIGDTLLKVEQASAAVHESNVGPVVEFNRPPRLRHDLATGEFQLPAPPDEPRKQRLPMIAAIVPVIMGAAMYLVTRQIYTIMFIALSPVMMLGSWWEAKRSGRADFNDRLNLFRSDVADEVSRIEAFEEDEVEQRFAAAPAVGQLGHLVAQLSPTLWERGPGDPDFLSVRVGLAAQPASVRIRVKDGGSRALRSEVDGLAVRYADLPPVPVLVDIDDAGSIGIAGPSPQAIHLARSVIAQVATLHSPSEVVITALLPDDAIDDWEWLKWLPHTRAPLTPIAVPHVATTVDACLSLLKELGTVLADRLPDNPGERASFPTPAVILLVDERVPLERARMTGLVEHGARAGIHVVWLAESGRRLPKAVDAVVEIGPDGTTAEVRHVDQAIVHDECRAELLDVSGATRLGRQLAPVVDSSSRQSRGADVPTRAMLVDILGGPSILSDSDIVLQRWRESRHGSGLRGPVGLMAGGVLSIDLRHDGPHGLIAGTTGAGKSEFLQSLLVGLATTHSPERISFLLVDYKGGAAFKDVVDLPHTVGLVTDLSPALVQRALVSLRAELSRREELLNEARAKDLMEMEAKGHPKTPPSLVIVVDEFAALATEVPEFVDGVVDVAQRGRSLGLHLLLATQRPAGVITGNIRANANLRVSLRVASDDESMDVVGAADAAAIDRSAPGRGVVRLGPSELITFQTGYVGGHTKDHDDKSAILEVADFHLVGTIPWPSADEDGTADESGDGPTDLQRLASTVSAAFASTGAPPPRRPWLDPLASHYDLLKLPRTGNDRAIALAVGDQPRRQTQQIGYFRPDEDGSLLIYGAGGTGKSTTLRSLATACCLTTADHPVGILGLDCAGRGLELLTPLPQVGEVVTVDDYDRVTRMLGDLTETMTSRADTFARSRAATLSEYRANTGEPMQRLLLLVDGYEAFAQTWERTDGGRWVERLQRLVAEGRGTGIHVALTGGRRSAFPLAMTAAVSRRLILRLASEDDYMAMGVPRGMVDGKEPPGRAVDDEVMLQVAIAGDRLDTSGQAATLQRLGRALQQRGARAGPSVQVLPEELSLSQVSLEEMDRLAIGLDDRLEPFSIARDTDLLIAGPSRSGKTTTALTIARRAAEVGQPCLLVFGQPPRVPVPDHLRHVVAADGLEKAISRIEAIGHPIMVVIDDVDILLDGPAETSVQRLHDMPHVTLVVTCESSLARTSYSEVLQRLKRARRSLLLQPNPDSDAPLAHTQLPRSRRNFPPGRALFSESGQLTTCHIAM